MAQKAILIVDNLGNNIWKSVYAGDLSFADSEATRLQAKYPTYTVTEFSTDKDSTFVNATINNPQKIVIE